MRRLRPQAVHYDLALNVERKRPVTGRLVLQLWPFKRTQLASFIKHKTLSPLLNTTKENAMLISEVTTIKPQLPQTSAQARIAVLKKNVDQAQVAVKAERKRQQVQDAQKKLQRAISTKI
jgi:hypothetical protein